MRGFKIKSFFLFLLFVNFTSAQGQQAIGGNPPTVVTLKSIQLTQALLNSPDPVSAQFAELRRPVDFLSKQLPQAQRIPRGQLIAELSQIIAVELNEPFTESLSAQTPKDHAKINWDWHSRVVKATEKFLNKYEHLLGRENIKDFLKRLKKIPYKALNQEIGFLREFLKDQGIRISNTEVLINDKGRGLRLPLKEEGLRPRISNEEVLKRLLNHFRLTYKPSDFLIYTHQRINGDREALLNAKDWNRKILQDLRRALGIGPQNAVTIVQQPEAIIHEFSKFVRGGYTKKLTGAELTAIRLIHKILAARNIGIEEVHRFRTILEKLRVPSEFHHNEFIRSYLINNIRAEQMQEYYRTGNFTVTDKNAAATLSKIKAQFEGWHYDLLKDQAKFRNVVGGLHIQYALFQAAIGAVMYMDFMADSLRYESHKNPIPLESFMASLSIPGAVSFGIFLQMAQLTQYRVYQLGTKWNINFRNHNLLKMASGPLGMASGYLFSQVLYEIYGDLMKGELGECAKALMKKENTDNQFITSCEVSALKWNEKFKEYGPDIVILLASAWGSQKLMKYLTLGARYFVWTDSILVRLASFFGRYTNHLTITLSIIAFVGLNLALDNWDPVEEGKEGLFINDLKGHIALLTQAFFNGELLVSINGLRDNLTEMGRETEGSDKYNKLKAANTRITDRLDEFVWSKVIKKTKKIDFQFNKWNEVKGRKYSAAYGLWTIQTDKLVSSHENSKELLKELYTLSHKSEFGPVNKYFDEVMQKRNQALEALTIEYTGNSIISTQISAVCNSGESISEGIDALNIEYKTDKDPELFIAKVAVICKGSRRELREAEYTFFFFSLEKIQTPEFATGAKYICERYRDSMQALWNGLCTSLLERNEINIVESDKEPFETETKQLIADILYSPDFDILNQVPLGDPADYINWEPDGLFSFDEFTNVNSLSPIEKLALARRLLSPFDPVLPEQRIQTQWVERLCDTKYFSGSVTPSECPQTVSSKEHSKEWTSWSDNPNFIKAQVDSIAPFVDWLLIEKTKAVGFYLLKDVLSQLSESGSMGGISYIHPDYQDNYFNLNWEMMFQAVADLIGVSKKGESLFNQIIIVNEESDNSESPDKLFNKLFYNLICGTDAGEISKGFFIPPRIFDRMQALCLGLLEGGPAAFKDNLFNKPVVLGQKTYENAYLALEEMVRETFTNEEELMTVFDRRAAPLSKEVSESIIKDFKNITEHFLKNNLVNKEASGVISCQDILNRYSLQMAQSLKGLEIPLFEVNYWINQLQTLKDLDIKVNVNKEGQNQIHCEVLELLKRYHDNYARDEDQGEQPLLFIFPEESFLAELVEEEWQEKQSQGAPDLTKASFINRIQGSANLVYIKKEFVLYNILEEFFPEFNNPDFVFPSIMGKGCHASEKALGATAGLSLFYHGEIPTFPPVVAPIKENCRPDFLKGLKYLPNGGESLPDFFNGREQLIYATIVSLYKSLDRYYRYLSFLIKKQELDEVFPH